MNRNVLDVRAPSSCESMRRLFVVCLESMVMVFELGEKLQRVCEVFVDHPKVAFDSVGWWSHMELASGNDVSMIKLGGEEPIKMNPCWEKPVREVVFLRPGLIGILANDKFVVRYVSGEEVAQVEVGRGCVGVCACDRKVVLMPGKLLVFDSWRATMEKLRSSGKMLEVVTLGMYLYLRKSKMFY